MWSCLLSSRRQGLNGGLLRVIARPQVVRWWLNSPVHLRQFNYNHNHHHYRQALIGSRPIIRQYPQVHEIKQRHQAVERRHQDQCRLSSTSVNGDSRTRNAHQGQQHRQGHRPSGLILGRHVREALANGSPLVALESTVITHGLPEPQNLQLALRLEAEISGGHWWCEPDGMSCWDANNNNPSAIQHRYSGVVTPATIGIVKGQLVVGLSRDEIEYLATRSESRPIKASRRDLPIAMALGLSAGTTVSATMAIATSLRAAIHRQLANTTSTVIDHKLQQEEDYYHQAHGQRRQGEQTSRAIKVFATGGMGGVHLGGELSMDISADLYEFARSPIGVVSSGFKSFLDTRRSLEFLETMGCTVTSLQGYKTTYQASSCVAPERLKSAYLSPKDVDYDDDHHHHYDDKAKSGNLNSNNNNDNNDNNNNNNNTSNIDATSTQVLNQLQERARGHPFPGFFTTTNKELVKSPWQCQTVQEAARILYECLEGPSGGGGGGGGDGGGHLLLEGGLAGARAMLLACPIPADCSLELDDRQYRQAMEAISADIDQRLDLNGAEKTPLILAKLNQATGGKTLQANMALLANNSRIGAHLAYEYAILAEHYNKPGAILPHMEEPSTTAADWPHSKPGPPEQQRRREQHQLVNHHVVVEADSGADGARHENHRPPSAGNAADPQQVEEEEEESPVIVVGCTMIDMHVSTKIDAQFKNNPSHSGVTFEGRPHLSVGGVGRNLAAAVELLGHRPTFVTCLGRDQLGQLALDGLARCGLDARSGRLKLIETSLKDGPTTTTTTTCFALVLMDSLTGQCEFVVANLEANKQILASQLVKLMPIHQQRQHPKPKKLPKLVVMDANLPPESIEYLLEYGASNRVPIFLEPTDVVCLGRLVDCLINFNNNRPASQALAFMSPNVIELREMLQLFEAKQHQFVGTTSTSPSLSPSKSTTSTTTTTASKCPGETTLEEVQLMAGALMERHLTGLKCLLVTMDKRGVLVAVRRPTKLGEQQPKQPKQVMNDDERRDADIDVVGQINLMDEINQSNEEGPEMEMELEPSQASRVYMKHFETPQLVERPVSASGAGDSFAAGFISGLLMRANLGQCLERAFRASHLALQDEETISSRLRQLRQVVER